MMDYNIRKRLVPDWAYLVFAGSVATWFTVVFAFLTVGA